MIFLKQPFASNILLCIIGQEGQVKQEGQPVSVDQEQKREESVDCGFRDNVGVETVAEVDWVDIVTIVQY